MKILFVYGTLQQGQAHDLTQYAPTTRRLGEGSARGYLYDLGHCPALALDAGGDTVWGEVYEVDESLFEDLNRWEAECGEFLLREVILKLDHKELPGHVYEVGPNQELPANTLREGRWPLRATVCDETEVSQVCDHVGE
ncbi:gamma-glutamylcyclotransferase family protein [Paraburkholderia graminis]|uniref:Gamma-glutamylcyclotransferase (GGCT)/AIG2-like uncharacterized protein YtfP n=1 Tax=Paraburkholderia graminis TaxID=60548 RepID=A0ABD5C7P9_9BURK|nr:gamma-glutamylcyclotransferase family protein [Paraburkholderia graminis]MDR6201294.1 gamma-glutamylcyclotransferase (GGCT)/AIG2-like uncharacterized protein YtfP [Paraburkholderia graminis]